VVAAADVQEPGFEWRHPRLAALYEAAATVLVAPMLALLRARVLRFMTGSELLSLVPGAAGIVLRRAWYAATLEACGRRLRIGFGSVIRDRLTRLGDDCFVVDHVRIGRAWCGSNVMVGDHALVQGRARSYDRRDIPLRLQYGPEPVVVRIGEDVWIGAGAKVLADVAAHTLVAAGAVVVRTFPEWSVLGGVPARVIAERPGRSAD
jgi:acetyltransferase-like isoleucine patch superfamily enzyme